MDTRVTAIYVTKLFFELFVTQVTAIYVTKMDFELYVTRVTAIYVTKMVFELAARILSKGKQKCTEGILADEYAKR